MENGRPQRNLFLIRKTCGFKNKKTRKIPKLVISITMQQQSKKERKNSNGMFSQRSLSRRTRRSLFRIAKSKAASIII